MLPVLFLIFHSSFKDIVIEAIQEISIFSYFYIQVVRIFSRFLIQVLGQKKKISFVLKAVFLGRFWKREIDKLIFIPL